MPTAQLDLIGRTVGEFEIREKIGAGGMGTVYKAYQRGMERLVALKVFDYTAGNKVLLDRFYQEARSAARFDHPNLVRAIAIGREGELYFYAMEYVEGESLSKRIKRSGPLAEPEAVRVVAAVAEALEAAHELGMVHRDVKPENVLLASDGRVKLADLGLVKRLDQDLGLTQPGKGLGTTTYMAPEQFRDAKHADGRCDIYALGLTLYTALTGLVPWIGLDPIEMYRRKKKGPLEPSVRSVIPQVSSRVETVIARATDPEPARRYPNCSEFLGALTGETREPQRRPVEEATRGEMDVTPAAAPSASDADVPGDTWYIRYFEKSGERKQLKLRSKEIRQGVRSGRLTQNIRISRSPQGPWLHLSGFNEFVDLVAQLSRGAKESAMESDIERTVARLHAGAPLRSLQRSWAWLVWGGLAVAAVAAAAAALWWVLR